MSLGITEVYVMGFGLETANLPLGVFGYLLPFAYL